MERVNYFFLRTLLLAISAQSFHVTNTQLEKERILGGEKTTILEVPYLVSIQIEFDDFEHICGGSIIAEDVVLTAGHCFLDLSLKAKYYKIRAGSSFTDKEGSLHDISQISVHEDFESQKSLNDIAIILVKTPFELDQTRAIIPLWDSEDEIREGIDNGLISGWGYQEKSNDKIDYQLSSVDIPIVNQSNCRDVYKTRGIKIQEGQICAGDLVKGGRDSCENDSGGPLVVRGKLVGVISFGEECGRAQYPGVYTKVAHYKPWIEKTIGQLKKQQLSIWDKLNCFVNGCYTD